VKVHGLLIEMGEVRERSGPSWREGNRIGGEGEKCEPSDCVDRLGKGLDVILYV